MTTKIWSVILLLFIGSAASFLTWLADFDRHRSFSHDGRSAMATRVASSQKPGQTIIAFEQVRREYPVRFRTEAGQDIATVAYVPDTFLQQMEKDGRAELIYLRDEPQRIIFPGDLERMPKSSGALALGFVSFIVGVLLVRRRHRFNLA